MKREVKITLDDKDKKQIMVENLNRCQMWMDADSLVIALPAESTILDAEIKIKSGFRRLGLMQVYNQGELIEDKDEVEYDNTKPYVSVAWDEDPPYAEICGDQNLQILADAGVDFPGARFYRSPEQNKWTEITTKDAAKRPRLKELKRLFAQEDGAEIAYSAIEEICRISNNRLSKLTIGQAHFHPNDYDALLQGFDECMKEHPDYQPRREELLTLLNDVKEHTRPHREGHPPHKR